MLARVYFCPDVFNDGYLNVSALLSNLGSPSGFVKALAYPAYDYARTSLTRASAYLSVSLKALESQNLTENQICCQNMAMNVPQIRYLWFLFLDNLL